MKKSKLKKKKTMGSLLAWFNLAYGGIFDEWWKKAGKKLFFKYAGKRGFKYTDTKYDVDCEKCVFKVLMEKK